MGLYDHVHIAGPDPRFVCSEGHDLTGEEFQTKDFGCTMGDVRIADDKIIHDAGRWNKAVPRPYRGRFEIYGSCTQCLAFVKNRIPVRPGRVHKLVGVRVEFEIEVVNDRVRVVRRTSKPTAEWLVEESQRRDTPKKKTR